MNESSNYWIDVEVERICQEFPEGEITVSSGISPSASYHIGHFREILSAEALAWGLREAGREARHVHVVDNMDPLRKRYDFLPEEYERYVGWPICLVPNPYGEGSYADHFFQEFRRYFEAVAIAPDEIVRSYEDLYKSGRMSSQIERVLERLDTIRQIFADFGREVAEDWTPVQVMVDDKRFKNARAETWDKQSHTIDGVDYTRGAAKLNWRLDWPARWAVLGVQVEPFSVQEHGAAGGSYDTGAEFSRQIFNYSPPIPGAKYGNVHLLGDTKKMSSSKGNLITPGQALAIIPPSILRFFIVRSLPDKTLYFDPGAGLGKLIDEYKQVRERVAAGDEHEFADAYRFADTGDRLTDVPFTHLINVYQAALGDSERTREILARTGYEVDKKDLETELGYIANWLRDFAPASMRFSLQESIPEQKLSQPQREFLSELAERIRTQEALEAEWVHELIYELQETYGLRPADSFRAIYQVLLGQTSGPKAGWFLTTIDRDWLIKRLKLEA